MQAVAYAKINWALGITGLRADGYHLLDTLMQRIALADTLALTPADTLTLAIDGAQPLSPGEDNLVLRAARLLQAETGTRKGAHIHLAKRIPMGAGLGGGSADAAAALLALCRLWNLPCDGKMLHALALRLGADVPFCLQGGLARAQGIGEALATLPPLAPFHLVILQPEASHLSTPEVFRRYDAAAERPAQPDIDAAIAALQARDVPRMTRCLANALQPAAIALCPAIEGALAHLEGEGALLARMTGSGSAVFGMFADAQAAARAAVATGGIATHTI